jgi:signal recognition particle subunit SRP72
VTNRINDSDLHIVVENNRTALESAPENPYLLHRKAAVWLDAERNAKLFDYQKEAILRNQLVLDLKVQKTKGVAKRTAKTLSQASLPDTTPNLTAIAVINAAAATHGLAGKELARSLQELARKRPSDIGLLLANIQTQLAQGHSGSALSMLEAFLGRMERDADDQASQMARFSPGLVALTVSLLRSQGRETAAKNELVKATKFWQARPAGNATSLLLEAGIELVRSSNPQDLLLASTAFEKLFDENRGSPAAAAGLIASLAPSNPAKVQQHVSQLPPVDDLIQDVDVAALLHAGVAAAPKSAIVRKRAREAADNGAEKQSAAKKRRKRKLPKSYEEGKTVDPERWLPLRDRSSYRPKGKKGKKKAAEATQGGMVRDEETLELVGGGGVKVEKAPPAPSSNKKKKKGKK